MSVAYRFLFAAMWLSWAGYWWLLSSNVKASSRQESTLSRSLHVVPLMFAFLLLWPSSVPSRWLSSRFIPPAEWEFWVGAAVAATGLLFTVWARIHLGRNWSGIVTIKENHELVVSGPYAFVRHPIYSGLLLAFVGSALSLGEWRGVLAVLIVVLALWRKLRHEEGWMREQFGEQYVAYSRCVTALIPFLL